MRVALRKRACLLIHGGYAASKLSERQTFHSASGNQSHQSGNNGLLNGARFAIPQKNMARKNRWGSKDNEKLDEVKRELCWKIKIAMARTQYNQYQLAIYLGTSQARISDVQNSKVERLTFNQLFRYLERLAPYFRILISLER